MTAPTRPDSLGELPGPAVSSPRTDGEGPAGDDGVRLRPCRDPDLLETVLVRDYFDSPICYFPRSLIRALTRGWFAHSDDIYFIVAEVDGLYAGFVFGHTMGSTLWRDFARAHVPRYLPELGWVWLRAQVLRSARPTVRRWLRRGRLAPPPRADGRALALEVPRTDRPFSWSPHSPDIGHIDLLFVDEAFRGRGLAPRLLDRLSEEMKGRGVRLIESHIDPWNNSSLRAFLKSNFEANQMSAGDFYLRRRLS